MDGDSLPVSAFVDHVDGQFEQGAAAYEKRGVAVTVPAVGCRQVHPVQPVLVRVPARHHPPLRPDRRGGRGRPRGHQARARQGQGPGGLQVHHGRISPLDCMGCGVCVGAVPGRRLAEDGAHRERADPAGRVRLLRGQRRRQARAAGRHRQGQPVQAAPARVLRRLRRLRRDLLRAPGHPAVRRPHVRCQRHGLLVDLGRSRRHVAVHGEQGRPRPRVEQLAVRG